MLLSSLSACISQAGNGDVLLPGTVTASEESGVPAVRITPTAVQTPTAAATATTTPFPTSAEIPEIRLFVPEYLRRNVLVAIQELASAGGTSDWRLVDSRDEADILLEPGDAGVPAGSRAIAVTVPFDLPLDEITVAQAETIATSGYGEIVRTDWALMPVQRKALRVDGLLPNAEEYTLKQRWSLVPAQGFDSAANDLAPLLRATLHKDQLVQLTAVGDVMLDRSLGLALENGDLSYPFAEVASALMSADITLGNLESSLGDLGQQESKSYTFQAPRAAAEALAGAGFDLLSLANNHAMDFGPQALQQAIELLQQENIGTVGAGLNDLAARTPETYEVEGLRVAFLSYVNVPVEVSGFDVHSWAATKQEAGVAWADGLHISEDVARASSENDLVVVLLHSGYEYVEAPSEEQMLAAHAAVDAGADLVIGHHAHVLQGIEFRGSSVIAYGLGNFAFDIEGDSSSMIFNVWLDSDGVRQFELVPAVVETGGRPRLATVQEASEIRQRVYWLSAMISATP